jgi:hypothetical protein
MKMRFAAATLCLLVGVDVRAETFGIDSAGVSFEAPVGFTVLSEAEIEVKFPSRQAPTFVVGNERRTTTIAFDLKPQKISNEQLPEIKAAFEQMFERVIPGLQWKKRDLLELQGQTWIQLELTSQAIDTDIYNIMLVTPWRGEMLVFNFNSTKEDFPKVEDAMRASLSSIVLRDR